jgi:hypothetical protein
VVPGAVGRLHAVGVAESSGVHPLMFLVLGAPPLQRARQQIRPAKTRSETLQFQTLPAQVRSHCLLATQSLSPVDGTPSGA